MSSEKAYDEATKTAAVDGEVVLRGPDGVAVSMTPEAAAKTAKRLLASVERAAKQNAKSGL